MGPGLKTLLKPDKDDILDVDVVFDGTCLTRGHSSNLGIEFVIDAETGFVLDYNVLSKFYQASERINTTYADNIDLCTEALFCHKNTGDCLSNYLRTPG